AFNAKPRPDQRDAVLHGFDRFSFDTAAPPQGNDRNPAVRVDLCQTFVADGAVNFNGVRRQVPHGFGSVRSDQVEFDVGNGLTNRVKTFLNEPQDPIDIGSVIEPANEHDVE